MKLRTRIPIYLGVILLLMVMVMYLMIANVVFNETKEIEKNIMVSNIERVVGAIDREAAALQTSAGDYAAWTDTYQFAQDRNPKYIDENFGSSSFENLHVNIVAVFNTKRELVYARNYDWENGSDLPVPQNFSKLPELEPEIFTFKDVHDEHSDFFHVDGTLRIVATRPIVTSEYEGPSPGTLVMMRNFDASYVERLSSLTQLKVSLVKDASPANVQEIFTPEKVLAPNTQRVVNFLDDNHMEALFTIKDLKGGVHAILKIDRDRSVNQLALETLRNTVVFFLLFALVMILGIVGLIDRFILERLSKLSSAVVHYETDPSLFSRIASTRHDELTDLAKTVKHAFEELNQSRKKIREHAGKIDIERKKLDAILHSIAEGVFVIDDQGRILLVNNMTKHLSGRTYMELLHEPFYKNLKFLNRDQTMDMGFLRPVFKNGSVVQTQRDVIFMPKRGEPIHVSMSAAPIKKRNDVIGSVVVFKDMTREYEIDKMKSEFVSIASHQLRTPLTSIKWMMSLLIHGQTGKLNKKQVEYLHNINESNERMIQLVNDLLNISRIESPNAKKIVKVDCDLKLLIEGVMNDQAGLAHEHGVTLSLENGKKNPGLMLQADRDKLFEILMNLLNNAIKYSKDGGSVVVGYKMEDGFVKISVKDTGIGIPKAQQSKIFQKFFRAENAVQMASLGTGLGLYYVKMVVESHGGRIWFESVPDQGSTFYFTIPFNKSRNKNKLKKESR